MSTTDLIAFVSVAVGGVTAFAGFLFTRLSSGQSIQGTLITTLIARLDSQQSQIDRLEKALDEQRTARRAAEDKSEAAEERIKTLEREVHESVAREQLLGATVDTQKTEIQSLTAQVALLMAGGREIA